MAQNISDILLQSLVTVLRVRLRDLSSVLLYLQITFEPPTSITETTAFTRRMWKYNIGIRHSLSCPRRCLKSQNAIVLVQTYGIFRSHSDHRTTTIQGIGHAPKVKNFSIKRGGELSLQSDVVDILVCTTIVVVSNRAQQLQAPCAASSYSRSDASLY